MDSSYRCQLYHSVCTQNNVLQILMPTLPFSLHKEQWTQAIGVNFTIQSAHTIMDSSYWCQLYHSVCTQNNGLDSYWCQLYHSVCTQNNAPSYRCQLYHSVCTQNNGLQILRTIDWTAISQLDHSGSTHRTMDTSYWCQLYHSVCKHNN